MRLIPLQFQWTPGMIKEPKHSLVQIDLQVNYGIHLRCFELVICFNTYIYQLGVIELEDGRIFMMQLNLAFLSILFPFYFGR